jgi:signal transduction histidine kinase
LLFQNAFSQEKYIDSLKSFLKAETSNQERVILYNRIFFNYIFLEIDSAYHYASLAYQLATKINYQSGLSVYLNNIGILKRIEGDYASAMENLLQAQKINETYQDSLNLGNNYVNIGLIYAAQKKYDIALSYFQKALAIKIALNERVGIGFCYGDIGNIYAAQKQYNKAIESYYKAIDTKARPQIAFRSLQAIGNLYRLQGDYDKAIQYFNEALPGLEKHDRFLIPIVYNYLGLIAQQKQNYGEAIRYFKKSIDFAADIKNKEAYKDAHQYSAQCYLKLNQTNLAYQYLARYTQIQDSLFNSESTTSVVRLQNSYELRKKQAEINNLFNEQRFQQEKILRQSILLITFLFAIVLLFILAFVLFVFNRKISSNNQLLTQKNQEISEQKEEILRQNEEIATLNDDLEKRIEESTQELQTVITELIRQNQNLEDFSYIVSHNIRAPIATMLGLLNIIERDELKKSFNQELLGKMDTTAQKLDTVIQDLVSILEIRKNIQPTYEWIDAAQLMTDIKIGLEQDIIQNEGKLIATVSLSESVYTIKNYLQNILLQLLSNAIRYQSPKRKLRIYLSIKSNEQDIQVQVNDNGLGLDLTKTEPYKIFGLYQRMHTHIEGKGFGLYLVKTQVEALQGTINVESKLDIGTTFTIVLPKLYQD